MGLRPTHRDESHKRCRPRVSGDPRPVDSRFRGNDVTFDGAERETLLCFGADGKRKTRARFLASLGMTQTHIGY
jgi:hypothetical protein